MRQPVGNLGRALLAEVCHDAFVAGLLQKTWRQSSFYNQAEHATNLGITMNLKLAHG
jgi:hypothetical protein